MFVSYLAGHRHGRDRMYVRACLSEQVAVLLPLGAHHLDLMFEDPRDPPCAREARQLEELHIRRWIAEAYAATTAMMIGAGRSARAQQGLVLV